MYVKNLYVNNFRNILNCNIELSKNVNVFIGDNAQGKTSLLESIYITSIGKSFRTTTDKELINFNSDYAFVSSEILDTNAFDKIDFAIDVTGKKRIAINKCPIKKNGDLLGNLYTVTFTPMDLNLIKLGPSERRSFMNIELCQLSSVYLNNLKQYNQVLKQRNNLLKKIQKDSSLENELFIWDKQLVDFGIKIYKSRVEFIEKINVFSKLLHNKITNNEEILEMKYKSNININDFEDKLASYHKKDIITGTTNLGIHKDDIVFLINDRDVRIFGSQGQQRSASLSVKLAEINLIKDLKNKTPILLLDDVLSELDKKRQSFLIQEIDDMQIILTCTGVEDFIRCFKNKENLKIFKVDKGCITEEKYNLI
ncbi:MAG: DNA replication/repair protein RecF [Lachnospirales bacterium]